MAAAIPATNKWLLTKQAGVALSGLRHDERWAERRAELSTTGPSHGPDGSGRDLESGDDPLAGSGRRTPEEPPGERKQEQNEEESGGGGGERASWRGECNCMECAECSGPAVRSSFISGLYVRHNLPGCQPSATISQPLSLFLSSYRLKLLPPPSPSLSLCLLISLVALPEVSSSMSSDSSG